MGKTAFNSKWWLIPLCLVTLASPAMAVTVEDAGALFTDGPVMNEGRMAHHIATLPDGKAIVFGGHVPGFQPSSTADVFDPVENTWTTLPMNYPHDGGAFVKLNDGRYLLAGGMSGGGGTGQTNTAEIYDPADNSFTPTEGMNSARTMCSGATLTSGKVLVVGNWYNDASKGEVFDPATNAWTLTGDLNTPRAKALVLPTNDGGAVVFGGYDSYSGYTSYGQVEYYNPATNSFSILRETLLDDGLLYAWFDIVVEPSSCRLPDGRYLLYTFDANYLQVIYTFDPASKQFARFNTSPDVLLTDAPWIQSLLVDAARNKVYLLTSPAAYPGSSTLIRVYTMDPATGVLNSPTGFYDLGRPSTFMGVHYSDAATVLQDGRLLWTGGCPSYDNYNASNLTLLATPTGEPPIGNLPPVADAGYGQTVPVGSIVTLDGGLSYDPDGNNPLTYAWSFTSWPEGSSAALSNPDSVDPSFVADKGGDYVLQLVVTDSLGASSNPATVTISTTNSAPVADAGPDQAVTIIGATVTLNALTEGQASYDPDGDPLTYKWEFVSKPAYSLATLSGADTATPSFVADVHPATPSLEGDYVVRLIVNDGWTDSTPSLVRVSFANIKPVADAGPGQSVSLGDTVVLNGTQSRDANGDSLTYQWSLVAVPTGSSLGEYSSSDVTTTFVPDAPGDYVAQLLVYDGFVNSDPATVQIYVAATQTDPVTRLQAMVPLISGLDSKVFKNRKLRNTLINRLNAVVKKVEARNYAGAIRKIEKDILPKINGGATTGAPDSNDWIIDGEAQSMIYPAILEIIDLIPSWGYKAREAVEE